MSKDKISDYSSTSAGANLNTDIAGINIDEGCPPSGINNAIRALMSQIKDLQTGVSGDTLPIAAGGTGEATAASARAALGVALNADVLGYVAPGAAGNFLTSTGTDWTSAALATTVAVTSVTAGAGISLSASTGDVTITNTGVTDITAGSGISVSANTGSITISASGGGGFSNMQVFTSSGTFDSTNVSKVKVTVVGGGGGGPRGNTVNSNYLTSGGGGGGAAIEVIDLTNVNSVSVTVGAGGATGNSSASAGGTSSFGAYCSATGGSPGLVGEANNPPAGGEGGSGSGGASNSGGGDGGYSIYVNTPMTLVGNGGNSILGGGGGPAGTTGAARSGNLYGGGASGNNYKNSNPGAAGAAGVVIVEY